MGKRLTEPGGGMRRWARVPVDGCDFDTLSGHPMNPSRRRAFLGTYDADWERGRGFPWVIIRREDGQLLGMIHLRIEGHKADVGYGLARPFWGQGYMTEAVWAVTGWVLAQPAIYRVWAVCDVDNLASARVLEKAGMQREGLLRRFIVHPAISPKPRDCWCYAIVK
jgi:ribosomal-protein-alanine N-acetyltransferase